MFPEILIMKRVRYKVIPIGIKTTTPAIKLFLILAKIGVDYSLVVQLILDNG